MASAVKLHPTFGAGVYALDVATNPIDLTDTSAVTGGYSARQLYVTGAGDVKFKGLDGAAATLTIAAKTFVPVAVQYVYASGTSATGIFAIL